MLFVTIRETDDAFVLEFADGQTPKRIEVAKADAKPSLVKALATIEAFVKASE